MFLEYKEMVVRTPEWHEITPDLSMFGKLVAKEGDCISLFPYLPIMLTIKDMFLRERNFKRKTYLRQEWNLE